MKAIRWHAAGDLRREDVDLELGIGPGDGRGGGETRRDLRQRPGGVPEPAGARLILYERALLGTLGYVHDLPRVAKMITDGALNPEVLVARHVPLAETPSEIARLAADSGADINVMVDVAG
jgi:hypothetical protein